MTVSLLQNGNGECSCSHSIVSSVFLCESHKHFQQNRWLVIAGAVSVRLSCGFPFQCHHIFPNVESFCGKGRRTERERDFARQLQLQSFFMRCHLPIYELIIAFELCPNKRIVPNGDINYANKKSKLTIVHRMLWIYRLRIGWIRFECHKLPSYHEHCVQTIEQSFKMVGLLCYWQFSSSLQKIHYQMVGPPEYPECTWNTGTPVI